MIKKVLKMTFWINFLGKNLIQQVNFERSAFPDSLDSPAGCAILYSARFELIPQKVSCQIELLWITEQKVLNPLETSFLWTREKNTGNSLSALGKREKHEKLSLRSGQERKTRETLSTLWAREKNTGNSLYALGKREKHEKLSLRSGQERKTRETLSPLWAREKNTRNSLSALGKREKHGKLSLADGVFFYIIS
ncbi:MAG: hypothetical protein AB7W16_11130 [Candidatus Obscuribacterales bacterium]